MPLQQQLAKTEPLTPLPIAQKTLGQPETCPAKHQSEQGEAAVPHDPFHAVMLVEVLIFAALSLQDYSGGKAPRLFPPIWVISAPG